MKAWVTTTWKVTADPESGEVVERKPLLPDVPRLGFVVSCEGETEALVLVAGRFPDLLTRLHTVRGIRVHVEDLATLRDEARRVRGVTNWTPNVSLREG